MNKELGRMFEDYNELSNKAIKKVKDIGDYLTNKLKPIIPDLVYSEGWKAGGVNVIFFYSNSHSFPAKRGLKYYSFSSAIADIIPNALYHIDTPLEIFLNKEETEKIKKILKEGE